MTQRSGTAQLFRWRAAFTAPRGQDVCFYWFDAADENEAGLIAAIFATNHKLNDHTIGLWCPERRP